MKILVALASAALLTLGASHVNGQITGGVPQTGYWSNPAEPGRGFFMEQQGEALFLAAFLYDKTGSSTWLALGPFGVGGDSNAGAFCCDFIHYHGGQTLLGAYQPAIADPDSFQYGPGSITLTASDTGTLGWWGGNPTTPIQRFDFGPGGHSQPQPAGTPEAGFWYAPTEPGRGYTMEFQGGQLFLAGFMYDNSGNPVWYSSGPTAVLNPTTYQGVWQQFGNGQTLGGAFKPATLTTPNAGTVTIQFTDTKNATLTLPTGRQVAITRFPFGGFTLTPSSITLALVPGSSYAVPVNADSAIGAMPFGTRYAMVPNGSDVFLPSVDVGCFTLCAYGVELTLHLNPNLAVGNYSGSIAINLCTDAACANPIYGSPVNVPYNITVGTYTALSPLQGAGDWTMFQGNAAHSGFVPVTLNPQHFSPRWVWTAPSGNTGTRNEATPVVTANSLVYTMAGNSFNIPPQLVALNEYDASVAWSYNFYFNYQGDESFGAPAVSGGLVYVYSNIYPADASGSRPFFWEFNASTGAVTQQTAVTAFYSGLQSPVIADGTVYLPGTTLDSNFSYLYATQQIYTNGGMVLNNVPELIVSNLGSGTVKSIIMVPPLPQGPTQETIGPQGCSYCAPVVGAPGSVFAVDGGFYAALTGAVAGHNDLIDFNVNASMIAWEVAGEYTGNPVYASGTVYTTNLSPIQLEARSETDGSLQWSWVPPGTNAAPFTEAFIYIPLLLTNDLLFVSTNLAVYAIEPSTRAVVWSYPSPGRMAISANGILYIATTDMDGQSDGRIVAINLH